MIDAPVTDPVITRAVQAGRAWADAGLSARLEVLQAAGRALAAQRPRVDEALRGDGLSDKLAAYYGDWIVRCGDPDLLERYARDHARWIATGQGGELMVRRPDGLVLLVVPGNSPTLNAATLFTILLPGNTVITRAPAHDAGLRFIVDEVIGGALEERGFSRDLVPVVTSRSRPFLDRFMPADEVRNVVFFGNSRAGRAVSDRGHELGKKVVLELEGSDHMIVWRDADVARAVDSAIHGFDFSTTPCPVPKHLLVHDAIYDAFLAALVERIPSCATTIEADRVDGNLIPLGDPAKYEQALRELTPLGQVVAGGYRMRADGQPDEGGPYAAPTLVAVEAGAVAGRALYAFDQEISFPLIPVVRFRGDDATIEAEMARMVADSQFGLRASVWTEDPQRIAGFTRAIGHVGLLLFNDEHSQIPAYAAPWGGPRRSGGPHGENHLFWLKTSHLQAVGCQRLDVAQRAAVFEALGYTRFAEEAGHAPRRARPAPPAPDTDLVRLTIADGVAALTLARPDRHNAIDDQMASELVEAIDTILARQDELHAVILRGLGPSFSSGGDLEMLKTLGPSAASAFMRKCTWAFRKLERLDVPVIAMVHGVCMGGGFELALHCDEIVASEGARFAFPEARAGYVTTAGSVRRLIDAIGSARAKQLLLSGASLDGVAAFEAGLVVQVCPEEELLRSALDRVAAYRGLPRRSVSAMKGLVRAQLGGSATRSWIEEVEAFEDLVSEGEK